MGTRLYLCNAAATITAPTVRGTWSDKVLTSCRRLLARKTGATTTAARAEVSTSSTWSVLLSRFVTDPINNAATIDGAVTLCLGLLESNAAADMITQLHAYVMVGDTDVVRGPLTPLALGGAIEWPIVATGAPSGAGVLLTTTLTAVNAQVGDRIVVEVGFRAQNSVNTSYTGTLYYGGTAADLSDGSPNVTNRPGWVDFAGAGVANAFSPPHRSGQSTVNLSLTPSTASAAKHATGQSSATLGLGVTEPTARRRMQTVLQLGLDVSTGAAARHAAGQTVDTLGLELSAEAAHHSPGGVSVCTLGLDVISYAKLEGELDISPPDVDLLRPPPVRADTPPVRFLAQDIRSRAFLGELPLVDPIVSLTLSGSTIIRANIKPEYPDLAELGIEAWATWIHVEQDGQLRGTAMLVEPTITGEQYDVVAMGFTSYATGTPYLDDTSLLWTDPLTVVRLFWAHMQSYPDAPLGVLVDQDAKTPARLGIPRHQDVDETGALAYDETTTPAPTPDPVIDETTGEEIPVDVPVVDDTSQGPGSEVVASTVTDEATGVITITYADGSILTRKPRIVEDAPQVYAWYTDTDCGAEIDNLSKTYRFDYLEQVSWNPTKTDTQRFLALGYPRLGRKRTDLRCVLGENLLEAFPLAESPGQYASQVLTRGKGEGRAAIRGYAGTPNAHRVRRAKVVTDQTITTQDGADGNSRDEIQRAAADLTIGEIVLEASHQNMPLGSYIPGDEALITGDVDYVGHVELWHRILSYDWYPDLDRVVAQCRRAEQFSYGRVYDPGPAPTAPLDPPDDTGTGGGTTAPKVYATPGECLKIGANGSTNHFKWQIGIPGQSKITEKSEADIGGGKYSRHPEFELSSDRQWVVTHVELDAPTTQNSSNPRSEGREMERNGTTEMSFNSSSGTHTCQADLIWKHVPNKKKSCSGMQLHGGASDLIQVLTRVVGGQLKLMARINGKDNDAWVLKSGYAEGAALTVKTVISGGEAAISIDGAVKLTTGQGGVPSLDAGSGCYFKVGAYPQSTSAESSSDYAEVWVRRVGHQHPGWPAPVFDSGGTGGTGGSGAPVNRVLIHGSCINDADSVIFDQIAKMKADYLYLGGDLTYLIKSNPTAADHETEMRKKLGAPKLRKAIASVKAPAAGVPSALIVGPSDHDGLDNDASGGSRFATYNTAYRKVFPSLTLPSQGMYRTWMDGRVRYILTDERTFKSPLSTSDGSGKTMLGPTQLAWFTALLKTPGAPLIIWMGDTEWCTPKLAGEDAWRGYDTARRQLAPLLDKSPAKIVRLEGNSHSLAVGTNKSGVDLILRSSPFNNETKVSGKGDGYDKTSPANGTEGPRKQQAAALTITDNGKTISLSWRGFDSNNKTLISASLQVTT